MAEDRPEPEEPDGGLGPGATDGQTRKKRDTKLLKCAHDLEQHFVG